jgi:hypothetical protein
MYCPHTVSLISYHSGTPYLTILRGVMLQGSDGRTVLQRGDSQKDDITLYIPFSVKAENAEGEKATFLPPKAYAACTDPEQHWTLQPEGESAGRCSFFVKGVIPEACSLAEAREKYDFVYIVAGWQLHDYGSRALQHYEVVSKVSSRYYQYAN